MGLKKKSLRTSPSPPHSSCVVHLLTFHCYATHLRGSEEGSVDRPRPTRGGPIAPSPALIRYGQHAMTDPVASLSLEESQTVLDAFVETCTHRNWPLLAAHVRSTHVHLVVDGIQEPSNAIRDLKAYASRALNRRGAKRWWGTRRPCARAA
jgi:hypothetical protein